MTKLLSKPEYERAIAATRDESMACNYPQLYEGEIFEGNG
jgi:hypothetical protein